MRAMSSARISQAIDRIDRALARIETQAALGRREGTGEDDLAIRHEALKASVRTSLGELDTLIERLEK
ncbi:hypothetical protein IRL76_04595 [Qipengyuania soli]|uniref:Uncharacterized protein n=2 Tax=Qipengyuania soli TaxID=2782568 RepID=A0A7S8IWT4_9SPHN|nr:hypothetical protein IRL76_04595 [Qipengyuania soli]